MPKLLGYRKFTSKAGKSCCVATVSFELTEREKADGMVGVRVDNNMFMPAHQVDLLRPVDVGHELVLDYSVSSGRAYLENVTVK